MAIGQLPINDLLIDKVPNAPPPEDTPNKDPTDPQQPDLTCTPDPTKTKAYRQVVGVENAGGESIWQSNRIVQQATKVLRTMESMASISDRTQLSAGLVVQPANESLD